MRNTSLILLIAGCVLFRGIAYASVAEPEVHQSSGNSTNINAGSGHSSDKERANVSSQKKDQKEATAPPEHADKRHVPGKISVHKHASMNTANRPRQLQHNRQHARPEAVRSMQKKVPTRPGAAKSNVVKVHTPPVRPATGVAISGQQFRNGRNGSATPALIGGAANAKRSIQAINGTEVSRKHLN